MKARRIIPSVAIVVAVLCATQALADDDTLRDLGTTAAPGEVPKYDGAQWRNAHDNLGVSDLIAGDGLSGGGTNENVTLNVTFGGTGTNNLVARRTEMVSSRPPVGSVVAWMKSFPNTPTNMPTNWVECNGQVLSDSDSVYNGQTIPNLNGVSSTKRFLRGSGTSGTTGGSESHSHGTSGNICQNYHMTTVGGTSGANHVPPYYEVVWIMRVK